MLQLKAHNIRKLSDQTFSTPLTCPTHIPVSFLIFEDLEAFLLHLFWLFFFCCDNGPNSFPRFSTLVASKFLSSLIVGHLSQLFQPQYFLILFTLNFLNNFEKVLRLSFLGTGSNAEVSCCNSCSMISRDFFFRFFNLHCSPFNELLT